jgi:GAF domain-containing protein/HAMP domain-containing protein
MSSVSTSTVRQFRGRLARTTLLTLLMLSLGPLMIMGALGYLRARNLLQQQVYSLLGSVANAQSQKIVAEINTGRLLLDRVLPDSETAEKISTVLAIANRMDETFQTSRKSLFTDLQAVNEARTIFNQFILVRPDGLVHAATQAEWEGHYLAGIPSEYFSSPHEFLSIYNLVPYYRNTLIFMSMIPIENDQGELIATLIGVSEPNTIRDMIERATSFTTRHYFVTSDGEYISINPFPNALSRLIPVEPTETQRGIITGAFNNPDHGGVRQFVSFQDVPVIAAATWVPGLDIGWVAEIPQEDVYRQLNSLVVFGLVIFAGTAALAIIILLVVNRRLVQPLLDLSKTVQKFSEGDWEERVPVNRQDELGLLSHSFNQMADDLSGYYQSLEAKVDERTRQIQTSAEISQIAISTINLDELLRRTSELIANRFNLPYISIYLIDDTGEFANLRKMIAPSVIREAMQADRIKIDAMTLIGWVARSGRSKVNLLAIGGAALDERSKKLPEARIEAGIPILVGTRVLGIMEVRAHQVESLNEERISELQTVANQIAPALQNYYLLEATQVNLQETSMLYQVSHQIAQADTESQIYDQTAQTLQKTPYIAAFLVSARTGFKVISLSRTNPDGSSIFPEWLQVPPAVLDARIDSSAPLIISERTPAASLPAALVGLPRQIGCSLIAILPVKRGGQLATILILGIQAGSENSTQRFSYTSLQPYTNLAELVTTALEKVQALADVRQRFNELQSLNSVSQAIAVETDLEALFGVIHKQVSQVMGPVDFQIALFDSSSRLVHIPYAYEGNEKISFPAFTLGNNLISLIVRNRQPMMINRDLADRIQEMGVKTITGNLAKSWLGAPLIVAGEAIGAIVVQDLDSEDRFSEEDMRLMATLALQVAAVVRNARLLEESRQRVKHETLLYEITNKIRRSGNIQEILETTARELSLALGIHKTEIAIHPGIKTSGYPEEPGNNSGNQRQPTLSSMRINSQSSRKSSPEVSHDA